MKKETWHDVPEWEGFYQYSNTLKIRSVDRLIKYSDGRNQIHKGRVLKVQYGSEYAVVTLIKNMVASQLFLHRFFATIFIPNPENKPVVNHKNGDKRDYSLNNLEWATKGEDIHHAYITGLRSRRKGAENHRYGKTGKLTATSKPVLDLKTGVYYESCSEASLKSGIERTVLNKYLLGRLKNKTSMVYV